MSNPHAGYSHRDARGTTGWSQEDSRLSGTDTEGYLDYNSKHQAFEDEVFAGSRDPLQHRSTARQYPDNTDSSLVAEQPRMAHGSSGARDDVPEDALILHSHSLINHETLSRLACCTDDTSMVRFSPKTGAITAATPARIVAQVSSESFMDYDLVSDFFLTFRAYLATEDLLGLLLTRLSWAINRWEEDGRVIRIRTFAALRHWILNYFLDDFVLNQPLRVHFCTQVNELYHQVSSRPGTGVSDLKILQDLKRCWNGRCSTYWDSDDIVLDAQQAKDIAPGGVYGCRDPNLTQIGSQHDSPVGRGSGEGTAGTALNGIESSEGPKPLSQEQKMPDVASTAPAEAIAKCVGKTSQDVISRLSGPSALASFQADRRRASHAHIRNISTSDSTRDQGFASASATATFAGAPPVASLIRGGLYPPAPPFVDLIAPVSSPRLRQRRSKSPYADTFARPDSPGYNPGTKKFMGTLRRALSGKYSASSSGSSREDISQYAVGRQGKPSLLPSPRSRSTDNLRDKKPNSAKKRHLRIDLLCAAVAQTYHTAQSKAAQAPAVDKGPWPSVPRPKADVQIRGVPALSQSKRSNLESLPKHPVVQNSAEMLHIGRMSRKQTAEPISNEPAKGPLHKDRGNLSTGKASLPMLSSARMTAMPARNKSAANMSPAAPQGLSKLSAVEEPARTTRAAGSAQPALAGSKRESGTQMLDSSNDQGKLTNQKIVRSEETLRSVQSGTNQAQPLGSDHQLRRRPGGDLRNIDNVQDLATRLRRQSTGSLNTTRPESVGSMLVVGGHRAIPPSRQSSAARKQPQQISLLRTHSSQHIRPSFEAAVASFTTIPDDGDGGLEATLLKLEGRYERMLQRSLSRAKAMGGQGRLPSDATRSACPERQGTVSQKERQVIGQSVPPVVQRKASSRQAQSISPRHGKPDARTRSTKDEQVQSSTAGSEESDSSVPLLERGLSDGPAKRPKQSGVEEVSVNAAHSSPAGAEGSEEHHGSRQESASSHRPIEAGPSGESLKRKLCGSAIPDSRPSVTADSFLLDENDQLTDLSSELSAEAVDESKQEFGSVQSTIPNGPRVAFAGHAAPTHPLAHPPSPAYSFQHNGDALPPTDPIVFQQKPLTPQPSPIQAAQISADHETPPFPTELLSLRADAIAAAAAAPTVTNSAGHVPFVLACESVVLAQQFTIVEKAALSEIDWSDLVEMKWDNHAPKVYNWVEYLTSSDHRGIDLVVSRFNIMVKWIISEIVMTQDLRERAQAVTKFIRIASHTRHMRNYATMLQITIALTSMDCRRLHATWAEVPVAEKGILEELEALSQPLGNFRQLRIEMETANLQDGCIPFLGESDSSGRLIYQSCSHARSVTNDSWTGLYVHDLTYNAQKPSKIHIAPDEPPLVNFEKYRTIATIVKSLLRLIDASTRYTFSAMPGVIERCLWLAALDDEKIASLSRSLES